MHHFGETYLVRIVHSGGDRNQTSVAFNVSKRYLMGTALMPETLFYNNFDIRF